MIKKNTPIFCIIILLIQIFFSNGTVVFGANLPPCSGSFWDNCFGGFTFENGEAYIGEWKNGKFHGQGTYTFPNGEKYVGEFKNDKREGQGTLTFQNGEKYVGEFKNDKREGQGTNTFQNGEKYVGEFKNGKREGQGTNTFPDGVKYVGEFKNDKKDGQGTLTSPDGSSYKGQLQEDKFQGMGTLITPDGTKYVGVFKNNHKNGFGSLSFSSGSSYVGEFKEDKFDGYGTYVWPNGDKYVGNNENHQMNGFGTFYYKNGEKYVGNFKDQKKNGQGIMYNADGSKRQIGLWYDDNFIKEEKIINNFFEEIIDKQIFASYDYTATFQNEKWDWSVEVSAIRKNSESLRIVWGYARLFDNKIFGPFDLILKIGEPKTTAEGTMLLAQFEQNLRLQIFNDENEIKTNILIKKNNDDCIIEVEYPLIKSEKYRKKIIKTSCAIKN